MATPRPPSEHVPAESVSPERQHPARGREPARKRSITSDAADALELAYEPEDLLAEQIPGQDRVLRGGDPDLDPLEMAYSGEEAPGGPNSAPDSNDVDAIGELFGVTGADEPGRGLVLGADLIDPRDRKRWENNPASRER